MPLSSEQQSLFDHARRALPRWFSRGKTAVLEWLHGYTQIFDLVRMQGQDWLDITYIDNASGAELDQHGLDRGTYRQSGEPDDTFRERLKGVEDMVTEVALRERINIILSDAGMGPCGIVNLRRDKAHFHEGVGVFPATAGSFDTYMGFGTSWNCYVPCNEASGSLVTQWAPFGSFSAVNTPTYQNASFTGNNAVGFNDTTDAFSAGDVQDVDATQDLIIACAVRFNSGLGGFTNIIAKGPSSGGSGPGYSLDVLNDSTIRFHFGTQPTAVVAEITGLLSATWYCVVAVVSRSTNTMAVAAMPFFGDVKESTVQSIASVGTVVNADNLVIGSNGNTNGANGNRYHNFTMGVGVGAAGTGVANIRTLVQKFAAKIFPAQSFITRGYRMSYPTQPMGYIVILPYNTPETTIKVIKEYLRKSGPAGYSTYIEVRGIP